jgi:hypothetical protein
MFICPQPRDAEACVRNRTVWQERRNQAIAARVLADPPLPAAQPAGAAPWRAPPATAAAVAAYPSEN